MGEGISRMPKRGGDGTQKSIFKGRITYDRLGKNVISKNSGGGSGRPGTQKEQERRGGRGGKNRGKNESLPIGRGERLNWRERG